MYKLSFLQLPFILSKKLSLKSSQNEENITEIYT